MENMLQSWIAASTQPGEEVFQQEKQKADFGTAMLWIIVASLIASIFGAISSIISSFVWPYIFTQIINQVDLPPSDIELLIESITSTSESMITSAIFGFCSILILAPISFLVWSGILFIIAQLFGGDGSFEEQSYLLATFTSPILIVNSVVNIVPVLGWCISLIISIYQLVLTYFALKVSHNLSSGQAVGVILTPLIILFLCICCFSVAIVALASNVAGSGF